MWATLYLRSSLQSHLLHLHVVLSKFILLNNVFHRLIVIYESRIPYITGHLLDASEQLISEGAYL